MENDVSEVRGVIQQIYVALNKQTNLRKVLSCCNQCDAWDSDLSICNSHYHKVEFKFVPLITYCRYCGLLDLWENLRNCRHERLLTPDACPTVNFKF